MKSVLDRATKLTQGEAWPNTPSLFPDDELPNDSIGDKYKPMDWKTFLATFEADMILIDDTIKKMAEVNYVR